MKVFIVFAALLMVFSMFLSFETDMNEYMQDQNLLKMLTEDCAEAAALTIDERTGTIDREKALKAAEEILRSSSLFPYGKVSIDSFDISGGGKGCTVYLVLETEDFFRLPFIEIKKMRRMSEYVWE